MVQIGNEINTGMAGEKKVEDVVKLLGEGSRAVRETAKTYGREITVAVHYTDIHKEGNIEGIAANLEKSAVDYDVFAFSYYPFWHGDLENMQTIAKMLQDTYGKQVVIAETSYCYTAEDGDGSGNSINGVDDLVSGYGATVQSQATMIRDICEAANEAGKYYGGCSWDNQAMFDFEGHPLASLNVFKYLKYGTR